MEDEKSGSIVQTIERRPEESETVSANPAQSLKRFWVKTKTGEILARDYLANNEDEVWDQLARGESAIRLRPFRIKRMKEDGFYIEEQES